MGKVERQKAEKVKAERVKIERPPKPPRGMHWPDFDSMFMPDGDPLLVVREPQLLRRQVGDADDPPSVVDEVV